jgi:hypothetical protein
MYAAKASGRNRVVAAADLLAGADAPGPATGAVAGHATA